MQTTLLIDDAKLADVLDGAGQGIAYWASAADRQGPLQLRVKEAESGKWFDVDLERALGLLPSVARGRHFASLVGDDCDAETYDVIVQLGAFGEVVYG